MCGQGTFLGFVEILHAPPLPQSLPHHNLASPSPSRVTHMEMLFQTPFGRTVVGKKVAVQSSNHRMIAVFQLFQIDAGHVERLVADNLGRREFVDLIQTAFSPTPPLSPDNLP